MARWFGAYYYRMMIKVMLTCAAPCVLAHFTRIINTTHGTNLGLNLWQIQRHSA